jgi:hypothetical protein
MFLHSGKILNLHDLSQVNRKGDEIAQLATEYSPAEIAYFKAIVRTPSPLLCYTHAHISFLAP